MADKVLHWLPRLASIAFIAFLSLFSLDVFGEHRGAWETLLALAVHLAPVLALVAALALAWRWEGVGALLFGAAGAAYLLMLVVRTSPAPPVKMLWGLTIAGPALTVAALFLASWLRQRRVHRM